MFDDLIPTPMKLELSEQQKMIRNMVREFAEKEVAPLAAELDKTGEYPTKTLEKMAKLGLLGIIIPQEYGGSGLDTISYATVIEEISRKCASTGVITSVHNSLAAGPIIKTTTVTWNRKITQSSAALSATTATTGRTSWNFWECSIRSYGSTPTSSNRL